MFHVLLCSTDTIMALVDICPSCRLKVWQMPSRTSACRVHVQGTTKIVLGGGGGGEYSFYSTLLTQ